MDPVDVFDVFEEEWHAEDDGRDWCVKESDGSRRGRKVNEVVDRVGSVD